ncbi:MAG: type II toxin-antitoxin system RelE/ParE family toxin [Anaerolineae bacterium]|nr:type II toxin-antitoxin system RelE/ParE family toxin [Anaerolineae bacterium]
MTYQVVLGKTAKSDLRHLEATWQRPVAKQLLTLTTDPRPSGVTKLRGVENEWRIRVGDYRVIYEIDDEKRMVTVLRIRHRREVYR